MQADVRCVVGKVGWGKLPGYLRGVVGVAQSIRRSCWWLWFERTSLLQCVGDSVDLGLTTVWNEEWQSESSTELMCHIVSQAWTPVLPQS